MFKVNKVVGIAGLHKAFKDLEKEIWAGAREAIQERTNDLFDEAYFMASAPPQAGLVREGVSTREPNRMTGSGVEVGAQARYKDIPLAVIGKRQGGLQAALRKTSFNTRTAVCGEVGFGRNIRPNGEALDTLKWPGPVTRVRIPPTENDLGPNEAHTEPPEKYIPKVILGTNKMYGRNIFRMALISDILYKKTMTIIAEKVKARLVKYRATGTTTPF